LLFLAALGWAQTPVLNQGQQSGAAGGISDQLPPASDFNEIIVKQNTPCPNQPKSLKELRESFNRGRLPSASEVSGTWVAISQFGDSFATLNCAGVKRNPQLPDFEEVIVPRGYSIELHIKGAIGETVTAKPDGKGSLLFPVDFQGDASPFYRCRLTERKTLACLTDVYREGTEFKKMTVRKDELPLGNK
jgi:hypothetical protein